MIADERGLFKYISTLFNCYFELYQVTHGFFTSEIFVFYVILEILLDEGSTDPGVARDRVGVVPCCVTSPIR